jgi:hypothetical protein
MRQSGCGPAAARARQPKGAAYMTPDRWGEELGAPGFSPYRTKGHTRSCVDAHGPLTGDATASTSPNPHIDFPQFCVWLQIPKSAWLEIEGLLNVCSH